MQPLVVTLEDDITISELISFNLINEGYEVKAYSSATEFFSDIDNFNEVSVFILDVMLGDMDGFEVCKKLRKNPKFEIVPIIMLTARSSESDKVKALDLGADDYITKPFAVREFLARVKTNARRFAKLSGHENETPIGTSSIRIDDQRHRVFKDEKEVQVTNREYELLKFMMINKGIAFSREDLLNKVWGFDYVGETRTVDVHIRQLRRKLEQDDKNPKIIQTVRGRGYRFFEE